MTAFLSCEEPKDSKITYLLHWTVAATSSELTTMTENITVRNSRLMWWLTHPFGKYHPNTRRLFASLGDVAAGDAASELSYVGLKSD